MSRLRSATGAPSAGARAGGGKGQRGAGAGKAVHRGGVAGPEEKTPPILACLDELAAEHETVDGARARREHVHGADVPAAEPVLDDVPDGREEHVGRRRAYRDELDVLGDEVRALQCLLVGLEGQVRGGLALVGDPALPDSAALEDPLVAGLHHLLEVGVGQDPLGRVRPDADDPRPRHSRSPCPARATSASIAALMCSLRPAVVHSWATRTAFLIAFTGEAPWQMMAAPSMPSSGAPPTSV